MWFWFKDCLSPAGLPLIGLPKGMAFRMQRALSPGLSAYLELMVPTALCVQNISSISLPWESGKIMGMERMGQFPPHCKFRLFLPAFSRIQLIWNEGVLILFLKLIIFLRKKKPD